MASCFISGLIIDGRVCHRKKSHAYTHNHRHAKAVMSHFRMPLKFHGHEAEQIRKPQRKPLARPARCRISSCVDFMSCHTPSKKIRPFPGPYHRMSGFCPVIAHDGGLTKCHSMSSISEIGPEVTQSNVICCNTQNPSFGQLLDIQSIPAGLI